jgi:hypothetical protein
MHTSDSQPVRRWTVRQVIKMKTGITDWPFKHK